MNVGAPEALVMKAFSSGYSGAAVCAEMKRWFPSRSSRMRPALARFQPTHELIEREPAIGIDVELAQDGSAGLPQEKLVQHGAPILGLIAPSIGPIRARSSGSTCLCSCPAGDMTRRSTWSRSKSARQQIDELTGEAAVGVLVRIEDRQLHAHSAR